MPVLSPGGSRKSRRLNTFGCEVSLSEMEIYEKLIKSNKSENKEVREVMIGSLDMVALFLSNRG